MKKKKWLKVKNKEAEAMWKMIYGVPQDIQLLGFYKGKPIFHDPKHPAPEGVMYFINEDNFKLKRHSH